MKRSYVISIFFPISIILMLAITTADSLSGKFFGSTIPVISNFYANDFLEWGIILFAGLGFLVGKIKFGFIKNKFLESLIGLILVIVLGWVLHGFAFKLHISDIEDYIVLGRLLDTWSFSLIFSGIVNPMINLAEYSRSGT